ncbi:MAG: nucleoside hydrolase [Propionibacteriaceae bacterium]|nr:nucleoside hydrolase [Propionibacteriaceae bacterium]
MAPWNLADAPWFTPAWPTAPFARVIVDNDFAGDPDDLYQLTHHLLSPEVDITGIICSHLRAGDPFAPTDSMAAAYAKATEVFSVLDLADNHRLLKGAPQALVDRHTPIPSPGAQAIIDAALDTTATLPLYVTCGGGLTDIASAYLLRPEIADRLTLIWIGGPEYPGLAHTPPRSRFPEYNQAIDPVAAQVVFNDSSLRLWLVPRNIYRQCLVSQAELIRRLAPAGALGRYLLHAVAEVARTATDWRSEPWSPATYVLGDQPLVLLTALQTFFQPDPASSDYVIRPVPTLHDDGAPVPDPDGRLARVYTRVDTRLMFEDMFAKFEAFAAWQSQSR